jgi:hypothetical protein
MEKVSIRRAIKPSPVKPAYMLWVNVLVVVVPGGTFRRTSVVSASNINVIIDLLFIRTNIYQVSHYKTILLLYNWFF